jgi:hypothetical protein
MHMQQGNRGEAGRDKQTSVMGCSGQDTVFGCQAHPANLVAPLASCLLWGLPQPTPQGVYFIYLIIWMSGPPSLYKP